MSVAVPYHEAPFLARDARLQLPTALLAGSVLAVGTFAALHLTVGRRLREKAQHEPVRSELGFVFPESGVVLCPSTAGIEATSKQIKLGSFIVLWLGDSRGEFVEATWAKVLEVDANDPRRIFVTLIGTLLAGDKPLDCRHDFVLSQSFWVTRDCATEAFAPLEDREGILLRGTQLESFDGDGDGQPDGYAPAKPPSSAAEDLVGRDAELLLVSRVDRGASWHAMVVATITRVDGTRQIATVRVKSIRADSAARHRVLQDDVFDVTWDSIIAYHAGETHHRAAHVAPESGAVNPAPAAAESAGSSGFGLALTAAGAIEATSFAAWFASAPKAFEEIIATGNARSAEDVLLAVLRQALPRAKWPPAENSPHREQYLAMIRTVAKHLNIPTDPVPRRHLTVVA